LADDTEVLYMISVPYVQGFARGLRWNDPLLGIEWPLEPVVISSRDAEFALLGAPGG
jgi:dTDP-4-dehydrorhamnose 3,5-epimerase